jgi:rRNA maturation endonuclease Nob1
VIGVELPVLVFIYLFVFLAAILSLWIVYEWFRQHREKEALRYRVRCIICASIFEDKTNNLLPRCPRCGSLNERYKIGGF